MRLARTAAKDISGGVPSPRLAVIGAWRIPLVRNAFFSLSLFDSFPYRDLVVPLPLVALLPVAPLPLPPPRPLPLQHRSSRLTPLPPSSRPVEACWMVSVARLPKVWLLELVVLLLTALLVLSRNPLEAAALVAKKLLQFSSSP